ncbi:MAG: PfkB family carbohydrate kinase [Anaerolineae bacterium]|nr:PfkB family carbohydrate kinase [Thermoflexales bacterium]MDW8407675.1 PfkB family carbohydrate kinase [Anaerolineae bacterium]
MRLFPDQDELHALLERARALRIGVLGDFCVDAYWFIDPERNERSIETGQRVRHVRRQRYTLGAAGNVVANLVALGVHHVETFGVIGPDMFGWTMQRMLRDLGATTDCLLVQEDGWDTPVYGKPYIGTHELQRLDFGAFNQLADHIWQRLLDSLRAARSRLDFLVVNQQLPQGWCNDHRAAELCNELSYWRGRHLVDARQCAARFVNVCCKLNEVEACRIAGRDLPPGAHLSDEQLIDLLGQIHGETPRFVTRGERGIAAHHDGRTTLVPGVSIIGPTDAVGAGDTATAMLAVALACRIAPAQAAVYANLSASITVRKLNQTGVTTPQELLDAARGLAYVFNPMLADEPRRATYYRDTDLEIVEPWPAARHLKFAVFDHDGTLSTLRQDWEGVMAPVMVKAILGDHYRTADSDLFHRVSRRVDEFIDQTTGVQTILQMDGLVQMVAEFGLVPESQRLDAFGYKAVYNQALMQMVDDRLSRLRRGELTAADFVMKGAFEFLQALRARGVTLFLVSGTDEADVIREAEALGYATLFDGGIFGAQPASRFDSKQAVLQQVLARVNSDAQADAHWRSEAQPVQFAVIGDGPVEIRLARRYGGLALGVASHEARRFGLNEAKRRRLIRAGAQVIVPDFSQWRSWLSLLLGV